MLSKLAWRNIWRNKSRSFITIAMVAMAVVMSSLMTSIKEGMYDRMIDSMVGAFYGFVQIQHPEFLDEKTIDNSMAWDESMAVEGVKGVVGFAPRLESFALAATYDKTRPARVLGVDPVSEDAFAQLKERLTEGAYLEPGDQGVLLGDGMAEKLEISAGDTIVLLGQGYHGVSANGKFPVRGIVKYGMPELSNNLVMMDLSTCQWMYGADGLVSQVVVHIGDSDDATRISEQLQPAMGGNVTVRTWFETSKEMLKMIEADRSEGYIFMLILYGVIAFGVFGTVVMMLAERMHEFGVMVAIGMKKWALSRLVYMELLLLTLLGALAGVLLAFPVCAYFFYNPIELGGESAKMYEEYGMEAVLQSSIEPSLFLQQGIIVALMASAISIFAFVKLSRLRAVNAMRA